MTRKRKKKVSLLEKTIFRSIDLKFFFSKMFPFLSKLYYSKIMFRSSKLFL